MGVKQLPRDLTIDQSSNRPLLPALRALQLKCVVLEVRERSDGRRTLPRADDRLPAGTEIPREAPSAAKPAADVVVVVRRELLVPQQQQRQQLWVMMVRGWFDAFRYDGSPTWYGDHRTPVVAEVTTVVVAVLFACLFSAFIFILPGVRKARWSSLVAFSQTLFIGSALLDMQTSGQVQYMNYNERFYFSDVKSMEKNFKDALRNGLPYPIITVVEYMSMDKGSYLWGRRYRLTGYYTKILLWLSFSLWIVLLFVLCLLPRYFSAGLIVVGSSLCLTAAVYFLSTPRNFSIPFPTADGSSGRLIFYFGWCVWIVFVAGVISVITGVSIRLLEHRCIWHFSTFLQLDYDEMCEEVNDCERPPMSKGQNEVNSCGIQAKPSLGVNYCDSSSEGVYTPSVGTASSGYLTMNNELSLAVPSPVLHRTIVYVTDHVAAV